MKLSRGLAAALALGILVTQVPAALAFRVPTIRTPGPRSSGARSDITVP